MNPPPSFSSFQLPDANTLQVPVERRNHSKKQRAKEKSSRIRDHQQQPAREVKSEEITQLSVPGIFYSDTKGDALNIRYGGLHQGDIPKHRLCARGKEVLGLPVAISVLNRSGKGIEIGYSHRRKTPRLTDSRSRALLDAPPTRSFIHSSSVYKYEEIDGFLRLPSRLGRPDNDQAYRAITNVEVNSDSESSNGSDQEDIGSSDDDAEAIPRPQSHLASLNERLDQDSSSVDAWLSVLAHTLSTIPLTSKNATTARSEITLSVLSRALSAHPSNRTSRMLRLKYIAAADELWPVNKVHTEWEDLLSTLAVSEPELWLEWLEWRLRQAGRGIDKTVDDAARALQALTASTAEESFKVRVLWRVAVMLRSAGFTERATALFQAQTELNFNMPHALITSSLDAQLDSLEEFWESEAPRIGESGALGWAKSSSHDDATMLTPEGASLISPQTTSSDPYIHWSLQESHDDSSSLLPTRSTDESAESDPYSTILFSDIRSLLFTCQSDQAKHSLRLAWLSFLGLHVPGVLSSSNPDDKWCQTHFTTPTFFARIFPSDTQHAHITSDSFAGVSIGREKDYASGFGPVKEWGIGVVNTLERSFDPIDSQQGRAKMGLWTKEDLMDVNASVVRNIFSQLRIGPDDHEWDTYALAFEAAFSVKSALKLSRTCLSTSRDSLPHWFAHAELERLRGRTDDARKIYETVLVSPALIEHPWGAQLYWAWSEMEWLAGSPQSALRVIFKATGVEGSGGVAVLRSKRSLDSLLDTNQPVWKARETWIKMQALLELLTTGLDNAMLIFDAYLDTHHGCPSHESLVVASLLMMYRNSAVLKNPAPPAILRERVARALEQYKENTIILGLFLESEKGQGVWGRVRGILGDGGADGDAKSVPRRISDVYIASWGKGRWQAEIERTRSGLASALANPRSTGPVLWRIYIEFEIRVGQLQNAKRLLFLAIGQSPLSKDLYLLAFGPSLRSVFTSRELNSIADTMAERGLRMRHELEGWREVMTRPAGDNDDDVGSSDEIEHDAEELRRLRPY